MKVFNNNYMIQTVNAPIRFLGAKEGFVDEPNQAHLFTKKSEAEEEIKGMQECKIVDCLVTYEF